MTPFQYAKQSYQAGKLCSMTIIELCGNFYLCDTDWNMLKSKALPSRCAAEADRSKILSRAAKFIN